MPTAPPASPTPAPDATGLPRGLFAVAAVGLVLTLLLLGRAARRVSHLAEVAWQDGQAAAVTAEAAQLGATLGLLRAMAVGIDPTLMPEDGAQAWLAAARDRYGVADQPVELMVQDETGRVRASTSAALVDAPHLHAGDEPCRACARAGMVVMTGPPDARGCAVSAVLPATALSPVLQQPPGWLVGPQGTILAHADPAQVGSRPFGAPGQDARLSEMLRRMAAGESGVARYDWTVPETGRTEPRLAAFAPVPGAPEGWSLATSSEASESLVAVEDALGLLSAATVGQAVAGLGFTALLFVLLRRAQRQREAHLQERLEMTRAAGHAERLAMIGTMTAGVAHDIRGPLTTLRINLELIDEPQPAEEAAGIRADLHLAVDQLARLASDLTRFSRAEADEVRACAPALAVDMALRILGPALRHETQVDRQLPELPLVGISAQRLSQVVVNLVHNASLVADRVEIRAEPGADGVWITVDDDGPGVAPAVAGTLFEPFVTTRPAGEGTGLGLHLCRRFISEAGGDITLDEGPGALGGARFRIWLPRVDGAVLEGPGAMEAAG